MELYRTNTIIELKYRNSDIWLFGTILLYLTVAFILIFIDGTYSETSYISLILRFCLIGALLPYAIIRIYFQKSKLLKWLSKERTWIIKKSKILKKIEK